MADTYAVTPDQIASEVPGLFPAGFGLDTKPSRAAIVSLIATADRVVTLAVTQAIGEAPLASDSTALLAGRYIINAVLGTLMRIVYAGQSPADVAAASSMYDRLAADMLVRIEALGAATSAPSIGFVGAPSGTTVNAASWF